jgi:hypothetical protein
LVWTFAASSPLLPSTGRGAMASLSSLGYIQPTLACIVSFNIQIDCQIWARAFWSIFYHCNHRYPPTCIIWQEPRWSPMPYRTNFVAYSSWKLTGSSSRAAALSATAL